MEEKVFQKFRETTTATLLTPGQRACTHAVINEDGDLLFVVNGDTIYGYNLFTESCFCEYKNEDFIKGGSVFDGIDISSDSKYLLTTADKFVIIYPVEKPNEPISTSKAMMACCSYCPGMNRVAAVSANKMKQKIKLYVYNVNLRENVLNEIIALDTSTPITSMIWPSPDTIILGDNSGTLYSVKVGSSTAETEIVKQATVHRGEICNLTISPNKRYFATASKDGTAKLFSFDFEEIGTYTHSTMVSCAAISPIAPHIVLASSADQVLVANTAGSTDFTINFFHTIFHKELASMKVHKSTVNWVGFTPDGYTLVTISHEGTCLIIRLGEDYRTMIQENNNEIENLRKEESKLSADN